MIRTRTAAVLTALLLGVGGAISTSAPASAAIRPSLAVAAAAAVRIDGVVRDGATVRAVVADPPADTGYEWLLDGEAIEGATGPSLTVGAAMVGHALAVAVTITTDGVARTERSATRTVLPGATSERRLRASLQSLIATLPGRYTVRVRELDGGRRDVSIGGATLRYPASTIKLFIADGVYSRIDAGRLALSSKVRSGLTIAQCLRAMIEPSDNFCADDLRAKIGTAWLNGFLTAHGYPGTRFSAGIEKTTTASDAALLLTRLARGTLLSKASNARFLKQLETQIWREAIPAGLPVGTRQASKPGTKMRSTGMVQTDAAIVWGAKTRYVLTVFGSNGATIPGITSITRLVQTRLEGPVAHPFVYQRQQMRTTAAVVLRAAPRGARVAGYGAGSLVEVIDSARSWYLVRIRGKVGWVPNTYLTLRSPVR